VARTNTKRDVKNIVFIAQLITPGIKVKGIKLKKGCQPPKNKIAVKADIKIILAYSPKKNKAKPIAEYSTL
jgi:hypothetical protein